MKEKIVKILKDEFSYIYCHNCNNNGEDCDDCHRKSMGWKIADKTAEGLADKIIALGK